MIRIVLVDDQLLIRQGIQTLLELEDDLEVVGTAANGREAIAVVEELRPDVVLMDIRMPQLDGVAATAELLARLPGLGVIILTTFDDDEYVFEETISKRGKGSRTPSMTIPSRPLRMWQRLGCTPGEQARCLGRVSRWSRRESTSRVAAPEPQGWCRKRLAGLSDAFPPF